MVLHRQILFSLAIVVIAEAILVWISAEQVPSLHRVGHRYLKLLTSSDFPPFILISALILFVLVMIVFFSVLTSIPYAVPQLVRTQSLNVLPLKSGVGQYIAIHATLTARDFFLAYFYPSNPFTCIFFLKNLFRFFPALAVANTGSYVGPQNKIGHPAGCRFPC